MCDAAKWPSRCHVAAAVWAHFDPLAALVGGMEYKWHIARMSFHAVRNGRDPFLPRLTKRDRKCLSYLLEQCVQESIAFARSTERDVLEAARKYLCDYGPVGALAFAQVDVCTELLETERGQRYFARRLAGAAL
jgi:hypothetical protein